MISRPLLFSLLAAVAASSTACKKENDEDLVKAVIRKAVDAANEKSAKGVVEDAAESFVGPRKANKREARRILMGFFLRKGWIKAFERKLEVTIDSETEASALLEVVLAEGKEVKALKDVLPTNGTVLEFKLKLRKIDDDWKFVTADYRHMRLQDL